jgi:flagellar biosynthetic protein FliP
MAPTFDEVHRTAIEPWMEGSIDEVQMLAAGAIPMREFMLSTTREQDIASFLEMREGPLPETIDDVPFVVITSAFVTSELTSAFQMGFALFLPFVVIDVVVASVLMSMGMFMLPPVMVSLPFKLLLFVLVDGWALVMSSLVQSF